MKDLKCLKQAMKLKADDNFSHESYIEAATHYFQSNEPFDAVILKFISNESIEKRRGLKTYLMLRFEAENDPVRLTLLIWWILDISLSELADIKREEEGVGNDINGLKNELDIFLRNPLVLRCLKGNKEVAYKLALSHLDFDTHIILSSLFKDYETLIRMFILQNKFSDALGVIKQRSNPIFYYKFALDILPAIPIEFLQTILQNESILDPSNLLPAFYKSLENPKLVAIAFQYFSHIVARGKGTRPIHAFLLRIYAEYKPDLLLGYLIKHSNIGDEPSYDVGMALRLCIRKNFKDSCVYLYQREGMYESAVKYALEIDLNLAKDCAKQIGEEDDDIFSFDDDAAISKSEEVKKHAWLMIARHMIEKQYSIADVLKLIKESGNVINADDLLPFFPEFTSIEALQGPFCDCLKEKSEKIQDLQQSIKEAAELAESIKEDIEIRKKTYRLVKITDKCFRCQENIFSKPFYAFHCWHYLHSDCCEEILLGVFNQDETRKYTFFKNEYARLSHQFARDEDPLVKAKIDIVKRKIGEMLSDDCPLCGKRAINLVDEPFYTQNEYEREMKQWKI